MKLLLSMLVVLVTLLVPLSEAIASTNSDQKIQLLSNRFRVDQAVDKIVFIIERKPGSAPIILVRPDGSKLYANRSADHVKWMDGNSGDMIEITKPMIGPWQIIGDILPSSEIRLATSLELVLDEVPNELFVGEKVKITARLEFNNKLLALGQVDDLIKLHVYLRSLDDKDSENFGAGTFIVGEYLDNGRGFDERSGDGVFTGELDLIRPAGRYDMMVKASNKVFEREVLQQVHLRQKPIKVDLISAAINGNYALRFISNGQAAKLDALALQVKVTHPDDTVEHIGINGVASTHLVRLEKVSEPGRYRIDIDVVGETPSGRNFRFPLETMKFRVVLPTAKAQVEEQVELDKKREAAFAKEQQLKKYIAKKQQEEEDMRLIIIIVMVNVLLLAVGFLMMWLFLRKKKPKMTKEEKAAAKEAKAKAKEDKKKEKEEKKK